MKIFQIITPLGEFVTDPEPNEAIEKLSDWMYNHIDVMKCGKFTIKGYETLISGELLRQSIITIIETTDKESI